MKRRRVEVNVGELDRLLEGARKTPLSGYGSQEDLDRVACPGRCVGEAAQHREEQCGGGENEPSAHPEGETSTSQDQTSNGKPRGHGRNGADALESARKAKSSIRS